MCAYMQNKNEKNYYKQRFITVQIYWVKAISKKTQPNQCFMAIIQVNLH